MSSTPSSLPVIRVGGVPEHFNDPWHKAIAKGYFQEEGVLVEWVTIPNGTGAMISALKAGEVDIIIALTEGLVSDIAKGSSLQLISTYVESPLRWGVIAGKDAPYKSIEDLKDQVFGISRYTSGSHLMVCVMATERGWHPASLKFDVQGNFQNLRDGVNSGKSAAFLWNYSTTSSFVESGEVKFIGEVTTPWSCFMMASTKETLSEKREVIEKVLVGIRRACYDFHENPSAVAELAAEYDIDVAQCQEWYEKTSITASSGISAASLNRAVSALYNAKVIPSREVDLDSLYDSHFAELTLDIESIDLYQKPELVKYLYNNLIASGIASGPVEYTDLLPFDQHHYGGVAAVDHCAEAIKASKESNILNIGSGLGGPSRYLAGKYQSQVLAVELQDTLHRTASELTSRASLSKSVHHLCGDILQLGQHLKSASFSSVVSWLTVLHIHDRPRLFKLCYDLLQPGGASRNTTHLLDIGHSIKYWGSAHFILKL
eukprot:TRINITY_DN3209_c0_g1_i2.p1 TRINITY_DN3209_c0_g1~~TRINITY_DN3209_c0_g1_i2.p1  ORF type:complete len:527 (-),score=101.08 TRINITY_DN3209_c0_g1_i2:40-1503(-)